MQRSQTTLGPDRRLVVLAIGLCLALLANTLWIQASNAESNPGDGLDVKVANFCSGDTLAAVLTNTTANAIDAVVSIDGVETAVTVDAFKTKRVTTPAIEDATYVFTITAAGFVLLDETVLRDCEVDSTPDPTVEVVDSCIDGGVLVTITNPAGVEQTVDVLIDGAIVESVTVTPGETTSITVGLNEDQTAIISTELAGKELSSSTITYDCETPAPDVTVVTSCADGGALVTITNPADVEQSVEVLLDASIVDTITVAAHGTGTVLVAMTEDQTAQVTVQLGDGTPLLDESVTYDCEDPNDDDPTVAIVGDCAAGGAVVTVTNGSDVDRSIDVLVDGNVIETVTIGAGDAATVTVPMTEDQASTVTVTMGNGTVLAEETITFDCEDPNDDDPTVAIVGDCAAGGAVISVSNTSDLDRQINVLVDGNVIETETVGANSDATITVAMNEDQTSTVTVTMGNGTVLAEETITLDCEEPQPPTVTIVSSCDEGGALITVTNAASEDQTVRVELDGTFVAFVPAAANSEATLVVPMTEDQVGVVTVSLDGVEIAEATLTYSCVEPNPVVTISVGCDNGAVVTISNTAAVDQTVKIVVGGVILTEVVVPAGESVDQAIALVEDVATVVEATFGGQTIASETLTLNCVSDDPIAAVTIDCEANLIVLALTNPGTGTQIFEVGVDGNVDETVVNAGQTVTLTINVDNGSTTDLTVVVGLETILTATILDNCGPVTEKGPELTSRLTQSCSSSVATVTLQNTGDVAGTYTVTVNGAASIIAVAAQSTQTFTFSLVEDATYTVSVTDASGTVSLNQTFKHNCKADTTVKRTTELPRTGSNALYTQILVALLLLSLGAMLIDMGKKLQRR